MLKQIVSFPVNASRLPADRVDLARNPLRRPRLRAFEHHVLDEMRDPINLGQLMPRTRRDPIPIATDRRCSMRSVRMIRPEGSTVRRMLRSVTCSV